MLRIQHLVSGTELRRRVAMSFDSIRCIEVLLRTWYVRGTTSSWPHSVKVCLLLTLGKAAIMRQEEVGSGAEMIRESSGLNSSGDLRVINVMIRAPCKFKLG
jgi:hypothetical protein